MPRDINFRRIDLTRLDERTANSVIRFLDEDVNTAFWEREDAFYTPDLGHFRFTHSTVKRARKQENGITRPGNRYEVLSTLPLGQGMASRVYPSLRTLASDPRPDGRVSRTVKVKQEGKTRVVKVQDLQVLERNGILQVLREGHACAIQVTAMHAKMATESEGLRFEMERRAPGVELFDLLDRELDHHVSIARCFQRTFAVLDAFKGQIADHHFVHRDIKSENIMVDSPVDEQLPVKATFIDYGFCKVEGAPSDVERVGTPLTTAPEIFWDVAPAGTHRSDIFSMGRVLACIWRDNHPVWHAPESEELPEFSKNVDHRELFHGMGSLSAETKDDIRGLLERMTNPTPAERPHITEVMADFRALTTAWYHAEADKPHCVMANLLRIQAASLRQRRHNVLAHRLEAMATRIDIAWLTNRLDTEKDAILAELQDLSHEAHANRSGIKGKIARALANTAILATGAGAIALAATAQSRHSFFWRPDTGTSDAVSAVKRELRMGF